MNEADALDYILDSGMPVCDVIKAIVQAPPELIPKLLAEYITKMAEYIESGGMNNTRLVKYLTGSTGAIVGLMIAGSAIRTAKE